MMSDLRREVAAVKCKLEDLSLDMWVALFEQAPDEQVQALKEEIKSLRQIRDPTVILLHT